MTMKDKETLFREKSERYLCCFNDSCPRHNQCLRWEVGKYIDPATRTVTCVNPRHQDEKRRPCSLFRNNKPVTLPVGMKTRFYYDMPSHTAKAIKNALISHTCRTTYYKYHNGERPITPALLATIHSVCEQEGWTQPLQFDGEVTDYVW